MDIALLSILLGSIFGKMDAVAAEMPKAPIAKVETVKKEEYTITRSYWVEVTGYSSREEETDDTPFVTASGKLVTWGTVATNALPFGTKVRFPEQFGDMVFVVQDRMHSRYTNRMDVWFPEHSQAIRFGLKNLKVEIIEENNGQQIAQR